MLALLLILISTAANLMEGVLVKQYNNKHTKGGFVFTALVSLFSMLFFVITDTNGFTFTADMLPYSLISGVMYASASLLTFVALGCGPFALSMLFISYSGIFSIFYGFFFLHEDIGVFTWIGIACMLASVYLTRAEKQPDENKASFKWLVCIIVTVIGCGMFGVIQKMQQIRFDDALTNEYMTVSLGFSALVLFVIGCIKDGKDTWYILKNGTGYAALAGLSNGFCNFLVLVSNLLMPLAIATPVRVSMRIILSFAISKLFFKEKFLPRQIIGAAIGTASLILLNV